MRKLWIVPGLLAAVLIGGGLWKPAAKKWRWFVIGTNIYQDTLRRSGLVSGQIGNTTGGAKRDLSELPRVRQIYRDYLTYSGCSQSDLEGRAILEIGPGDNLGVALQFVAAGARPVVCFDRFIPFQASSFHRALYTALRAELSEGERQNYDAALHLTDGIRLDSDRIQHVYGSAFEQAAASMWRPESFQWIVSNAVLEEVSDIDRAFQVMDRLLAPGGRLVHRIDLGDYGMFSKHGFHSLEFLTVPDRTYRWMTEASGQPNRCLVDYYRGKMKELGYEATLHITSILGSNRPLWPGTTHPRYGIDYTDQSLEMIRTIRPRLVERYRRLPDEDLLVTGIVLAARKARQRSD